MARLSLLPRRLRQEPPAGADANGDGALDPAAEANGDVAVDPAAEANGDVVADAAVEAPAPAPSPAVAEAPAPASPAAIPAPAKPKRRRRRRHAPPPGELRRERRALLRLREERLRDLGGLALEMYRRDRFREDLVLERCAQLVGLEARIHELDALLGSGRGFRRNRGARCECGAPLLWRARFCANCGRPAAPPPPAEA